MPLGTSRVCCYWRQPALEGASSCCIDAPAPVDAALPGQLSSTSSEVCAAVKLCKTCSTSNALLHRSRQAETGTLFTDNRFQVLQTRSARSSLSLPWPALTTLTS